MFRRLWLNAFFFVIAMGSCTKPPPTLEGVDMDSWRMDKNACAGNREGMIGTLVAQKTKLLALSELEIVAVLGKPDQNELYTRNQKFYYYFVDPAPVCNGPAGANKRRLVVRFNAMGMASEILLEE